MNNIIFDIETTGLNAMIDRITCVSFNSGGDTQTLIAEDESEVLNKFWAVISMSEGNDKLIGFNSEGFDIPFLIKRSLINRIKIPKFKSLDLRKMVNGFFYNFDKYVKGTLDDWAKVLGIEAKKTNGIDAIASWRIGDWNTLKEHCEYDVVITKALYKRCAEVGLI